MKKFFSLLAASVMVVGFSSQAMAAFNNGDLIRVVYQSSATGTVEIAADLGTAPAVFGTVKFTTDPVNYSSFTGAGYGDLYVAYYVGIVGSPVLPTAKTWLSGVSSVGKAAVMGFATAATSISMYYKSLSSTSTQVTANITNSGSFWSRMEVGQDGRGSFYLMQPYGGGTANLASLGTVGYVDQNLYYYGTGNNGVNRAGNGTLSGTMRTYADGTSELITTPVPATIYLLGSGLFGLIGMRRKIAVI